MNVEEGRYEKGYGKQRGETYFNGSIFEVKDLREKRRPNISLWSSVFAALGRFHSL